MEPTFERLIDLGLSQNLKGWDWSWYEERTQVEPLPWDYESEARLLVAGSQAVLDIDTGGGELFSRLGPFPMVTWATEGYPPNVALARARLEPLGVQVADISEIGGLLPFVDDTFDLVLNRHGGFYADELERVMQSGGRFYTQQVGGENCLELNQSLQDDVQFEYSHCSLTYVTHTFAQAGLKIITAKEYFAQRKLFDIASVVFYLKAIPWQIENFSVDIYREKLLRLHKQIQRDGAFIVREHRILIEAIKP